MYDIYMVMKGIHRAVIWLFLLLSNRQLLHTSSLSIVLNLHNKHRILVQVHDLKEKSNLKRHQTKCIKIKIDTKTILRRFFSN